MIESDATLYYLPTYPIWVAHTHLPLAYSRAAVKQTERKKRKEKEGATDPALPEIETLKKKILPKKAKKSVNQRHRDLLPAGLEPATSALPTLGEYLY